MLIRRRRLSITRRSKQSRSRSYKRSRNNKQHVV